MDEENNERRDPAGHIPPGSVIGDKFEVVEYVASGGMGFIYRARTLSTGQVVAVKIMRQVLRNDPTAVKRFAREAKTVSRLYHPNTITLHDWGTSEDGLMYIVMEWLEGTDLADVLSQNQAFDPLRSARIGVQVARSLQEAHDKGIVHRDLKPENVFLVRAVQDEDFVKVLDFGIAKIVDGPAQTQITRLGMVCGTPDFMSPEQGRGEELDGRSDVYALGCVLFTLLTGDVPFPADNPIRAVMRHQLEAFPDLPGGMPSALDAIVKCAAEKKREDRYATAGDMADALEDFIAMMTGRRPDRTDELPAAMAPTQTQFPIDVLGDTVMDQPQISRDTVLEDDGEAADSGNPTVVMPQAGDLRAPGATDERAIRGENPQTTMSMGKVRPKTPWLIIVVVLAVIGMGVAVAMAVLNQSDKPDTEKRTAGDTSEADTANTDPPDVADVAEEVEAVAPVEAIVTITSTPTAVITGPDGEELGETPVVVRGEEGFDGVFVARAEGHEVLKRLIQVRPGESPTVELALTATPPVRCAVRSKPGRASVTRDGEVIGTTPAALEVPFGAQWTLTIDKKGYLSQTVQLEGVKPCAVQVTLESTKSGRKPRNDKPDIPPEPDEPEKDEPRYKGFD